MSNESQVDELQMTFWEHLGELRGRMFKALLGFCIGAGIAWYFRQEVLFWVAQPLMTAWGHALPGAPPSLHFSAPHAAFFAYLKLSLLAGLLFSMPLVFYQIWAFVAPGLYSRERRFALPFVGASTGLFLGGGYFAWRIAFPMALEYLLRIGMVDSAELGVQPTLMIDEYIEFFARLILAFGIVFELPILAFFLSVAGLVTHRHLIKFFRYFIVIAFLLGAVITPPDPLSQLLLAIPLCGLYLVSIGIAWLVARSRRTASSS